MEGFALQSLQPGWIRPGAVAAVGYSLHEKEKMKRYKIFLLLLLASAGLALSGCAGGTGIASSWPGLSVSEDQNTAYISNNTHVYAVRLDSFTEAWRFPIEADNNVTFYAEAAITSTGDLLVGSYNGTLYRLNSEGQEITSGNWPFMGANNRYIAAPLAYNGEIFAPNADQTLYALNLDGSLLWEHPTGQSLWARPVANGNAVYVASMDHRLYALDFATGEELWTTEDLGGAIVGSPALSEDGTLFLGTFNSEMIALETESGREVWRFPTQGWVWSSPALQDGVLFFGDLEGYLYAVDAETGQEVWRLEANQGPRYAITGAPVVKDGTLYYGSEDGSLYLVDIENGSRRRLAEVGAPLYASPVLTDEYILVAPMGLDQFLIAYDYNGVQQQAFAP